MKNLILISLTILVAACGKAPTSEFDASGISPSLIIKTALVCSFVETVPTSSQPITINYTLETFEDGHMEAICNSSNLNLIQNLTCLSTNPYNYSYEYTTSEGITDTMNVSVSASADPIGCHILNY